MHRKLTRQEIQVLRLAGKNIEFYRKSCGMSREALAFKAEMSTSYLFGIEKGRRNCSVATLFRLARALGIGLPLLVTKRTNDEAPPFDYSMLFYGLSAEQQTAAGEIIESTLTALQKLPVSENEQR